MLLPTLLRAELPGSAIGFFLHIPFPSYEIYRLLPERREILEGLLGCDLIGFHIYDYARHFMSSCLRTLGIPSKNGILHHEGRVIKVDAYPIGIDYAKFRSTLRHKSVIQEFTMLKETYGEQKVILSIDRLDYSKGIMQRLEGFALLLKNHPEYHKRVKLVMVAVPSRTQVETYKNLRDTIEQTVSRINGELGTIDWAPISYQFQNLPFEKIVALYHYADIALVTPLRDGMNLVAKEYVASKTRTRPGVLVLSEMAGAIDELPEAISINPNDVHSVTRAIRRALRMPKKERVTRQDAMQHRIADYTVQRWGTDFIDDLELTRHDRAATNKHILTSSEAKQLVLDYSSAASRLILLDYDGTLQTFKSSPRASLARPSQKLLGIIRRLAEHPATTVCIISGRKRSALESWFGRLPVSLVAEHGAWFKHGGEWTQIDSTFHDQKATILPLLRKYTARTAGSLIEEKDYALVWHYRNVPAELAYVRSTNLKRELMSLLAGTQIGVFDGRKIIEVKPREVHKGHAASELHDALEAEFVFCAGDDYTDEDMFEALPRSAYTIKVGYGDTGARFRVTSVDRMVRLLEQLSKAA